MHSSRKSVGLTLSKLQQHALCLKSSFFHRQGQTLLFTIGSEIQYMYQDRSMPQIRTFLAEKLGLAECILDY